METNINSYIKKNYLAYNNSVAPTSQKISLKFYPPVPVEQQMQMM